MKQTFRFLFLTFVGIILMAFSGRAQELSAPDVAPVANLQDSTKSLLWEVSGKDLTSPSWVYGTIHMIGADDYFLTKSTEEVFQKADLVTFEINMENMFSITTLLSMMGNAMMDNGTTLRDLLTDEEYQIVKKYFDEAGMPLFLFEKVKPLFLSSMTAGTGEGSIADGGMKSYEMEFMDMAKQQEKEMEGLETIEFQMGIFDSIPYKDQAQMLLQSIQSEGGEDDEFDKMVELYKSQDIQAMQAYFEGDEEMSNYEDVLLVKRNENWIPIMEEMMKKQTTFFAVGAGHLGGEKGVLNLLHQAGYQLKPIID